MIIVPLVDVHARACTCDGESFTDADCAELACPEPLVDRVPF
jgi:hypothetical protein